MAKIKDLLLVSVLNIEAAMQDVKYGTGTFKNILEKVKDGTIGLLVNNNGDIIGGSYNSGKVGAEDSIEQMKFERAYCGKPLMAWVLKAVELKNANVSEVIEDGYNVKVIVDGNEVVVTGYEPSSNSTMEEDLPSEVEIDFEEVNDIEDVREIKNYLRRTYGYCLARGCEPTIECDVDDEVIYVSDIEWGRKLSQTELANL